MLQLDGCLNKIYHQDAVPSVGLFFPCFNLLSPSLRRQACRGRTALPREVPKRVPHPCRPGPALLLCTGSVQWQMQGVNVQISEGDIQFRKMTGSPVFWAGDLETELGGTPGEECLWPWSELVSRPWFQPGSDCSCLQTCLRSLVTATSEAVDGLKS